MPNPETTDARWPYADSLITALVMLSAFSDAMDHQAWMAAAIVGPIGFVKALVTFLTWRDCK
jgi:ATP/ADP translocase